LSFRLKLDGFQETLNKLEKMDNEVSEQVDTEIGQSLVQMQQEMIRIAPVGRSGFLKNHIKLEQKGKLNWTLGAYMPYSAYLNWGTITRVKVTSFWSNYAALFKGKGIRKTGGIYPTFFFTGVIDREVPKMIKRLKEIVK
jgi:hypothetical protein